MCQLYQTMERQWLTRDFILKKVFKFQVPLFYHLSSTQWTYISIIKEQNRREREKVLVSPTFLLSNILKHSIKELRNSNFKTKHKRSDMYPRVKINEYL